jgi:colicin import membrane protein
MNYKKAVVIASAVGSSMWGAIACNRPADQEAEAREAQQEATQTAVEAQREASEEAAKAQATANEAKQQARKEAAEAQVQANEEQRAANDKIADSQHAANERAGEAQKNANEAARDADQSLSQAKADYRQKAQRELDELKNALDELRAKSTTATGNAKTSLNNSIRTFDARRTELEKEIVTLDSAKTSEDFNRRTAQLDKQMERLRDQVDAADKKI